MALLKQLFLTDWAAVPHILIILMISLGLPLRCKDCFRKSSDEEACRKFSDWPLGNSNQWPCVPGILSCKHMSQDAGSHVTSCVFHQVMYPSGAEWSGWVNPTPTTQQWNALIGCNAALINLSLQKNGYELQGNGREHEGMDKMQRSWTWWNGQWGLIKVKYFKLSGGRLSWVEGRVALSAAFTFNSIPVVYFDTVQRTNKFL